MNERTTDTNKITEGVIWKQLLIFFFPILVGTLFQQLYNTVDAIIVGRFVGKQALASVGGSASVLSNLVIGFFTGLSAGASVSISQFYGAKDTKNLHKGLHTAYAFSIVSSLILSVLGWILTPWMLEAIHTPADTMADSIIYLRLYFLGMLAVMIFNMGSAIMRAIGDSKRPLYYLIVCCVLNIILDIIAVVYLHMGIAGAAIATIISQAVSAILVSHALMTSYGILKLKLREIRFDFSTLKLQLRIGFPGGFQACMYSISNIIIQSAINDFGTDTAAAWAAWAKLDALFWAIMSAFGLAISTFTGQNYGAGKTDRIFKSVRVCMIMSLGICSALLAFIYMFCDPLFQIFTGDAGVVQIGVYMLRLLLPAYIIYIFIEILSGALRGIGDVLIPTISNLVGVCAVRIPFILIILPRIYKIETILISYPIAWIATLIILIPYYFFRKRAIKKNL